MSRPLHPDLLDYLRIGLSIHLGGRTAQGLPLLNRALALRVESDHRLSVLLSSPAADTLLDAIREVPQVAVVLCQPTTHRTVQIKGRDAVVSPARPEDWLHRSEHKLRFVTEIRPFGFDEVFASAWLDVDSPDRLHAVTFTPYGAWNQSPGPGAGRPIEVHA
ncbi:hypothetical protein [uncultured Aquabacterium sp.]|uniref:hypothetical protein n=1 Tax=uncultured Aquabacterium sp. TaxID=158753 RepID=UPI0026314198|nr:hypothetical protein [uncultured Aquabacterium sp.]